jgi:hypothetical protein
MRLSDILRVDVIDSTGASIGRVQDIRCVRDGPVQGAFGPAYRLHGLVVGTHGFGARLGYDRSNVKGPAALKTLFRWLHANDRFVEWPLVAKIEEGRVHLKAPKSELPRVPTLRQ